MKEEILYNLKQVHARIENACKASGRQASDVQLLLATKTVSAAKIRIAIEAGESLIGENKMQEFRDKDAELKDLNIERHFIGLFANQQNKRRFEIRNLHSVFGPVESCAGIT